MPLAAAPACGPDGSPLVEVASVGADWSVALADGRLVRLAGLDPVAATTDHPARPAEARARLAAWLVGRRVALVVAAGAADRWGRIAGLLFAPADASDSAAMLSVATALADAGLARGRPESAAAPCWPAIRDAEAGARAAGLGLWDDPAYAVLHPGDDAALGAALGSMAIVEGRVRRSFRGRSRFFIRMGEKGADVTASLAIRDLFILDRLGLHGSGVDGAVLRVRGDLEDRTGFSIDVIDEGQVEVLEGPAKPDGIKLGPKGAVLGQHFLGEEHGTAR